MAVKVEVIIGDIKLMNKQTKPKSGQGKPFGHFSAFATFILRKSLTKKSGNGLKVEKAVCPLFKLLKSLQVIKVDKVAI